MRSRSFDATRFQDDARVVLIDLTDDGLCSFIGRCRVLKFLINDAEKHFWNREKDGIVLARSMVTEEVVTMRQGVMGREKYAHRWQTIITVEKKMDDIERRLQLGGPIPRMVFEKLISTVSCNFKIDSVPTR